MTLKLFSRPRLLTAAGCAVLLAIPFLLVDLPPITDLPQQAAQVRLLGEALSGSGDSSADNYRVQPLHPNKLGYLPLIVAWWISGPLAAGRLGLLAIGLLWVAAVHALARATGREGAMAVLASLFFFNHTVYWGFLNFVIGFPTFVVWTVMTQTVVTRSLSPRLSWKDGMRLLGAGLLLYFAHVLWLAVGLVWLAAVTLLDRRPPAEWVLRALWLLPVGIAVAAWYAGTFTTGGVDERTFWGRPPWVRLSPSWMLPAAFGGLTGPVEGVLALAVIGWLLLGLWQHRRGLATAVDRRLALLGLLFVALALGLPEVHQHTIFFAARWVPAAAVLLVLAAPAPRLRGALHVAVPWVLLVTLTVSTAAAWTGFEREELAGFRESLEALPDGPLVLGLDFVRTSPRIRGFPYYHLFAYAQVLRGGGLNRSFADEASSLVVFRELPKHYAWTDRLEWRPERFRRSDRDYFDYILVHAGAERHAFFERDPHLRAATGPAQWRLYQVLQEGTASE